jgi:hypothetical protein
VFTTGSPQARNLPLFRGINFSRLEIEADLGGAIFVVGSTVCLLIGIPSARPFFAGTLAGGAALAVVIAWWHRTHPGGGPQHVTPGPRL